LSARNRAINRATSDGRDAALRHSASLATENSSGEILLFDILIPLACEIVLKPRDYLTRYTGHA
jgi:hypothetical protein